MDGYAIRLWRKKLFLLELLRTTNLKRNNQAKNIRKPECEKAVGLIGWLAATSVYSLVILEKSYFARTLNSGIARVENKSLCVSSFTISFE